MPDQVIAYEARDLARALEQQLEAREKLHDERHVTLQTSILSLRTEVTLGQRRIVQILTWAGGMIITLILSVLGWSLVQQFNANEAQKARLQDQVVQLEAAAKVTRDSSDK